jgi:hypothetical protein
VRGAISDIDVTATAKRRTRTLLILYTLVLVGFVLPRLAVEAYDDSYFFKRVAVNLLDRGALAWNVDEGPVYGLTSQTFQLVSILVAALARNHYVLGVRVVLVACLLVTCGGLVKLTRPWDRGLSALYALCSPVVLYMALSGMETAFALALLTGYLWLIHAPAAPKHPFWLAPVVAVFVCLTRPDAAVLVAPTLLFERYRTERRLPWREALVLGAGALLAFSVLRLVYGTFLPLPFYAKTRFLSPYDPHFLELSTQLKHIRFGLFLAVALPLAWLAVRRLDGTNGALLASVLVYETYLFATTVEVMGMQGRFYAPALPLLCVAAARGAATPRAELDRPRTALAACALYLAILFGMSHAHWLPRPDDWWMDTVDPWFSAASVLGGLLLIASPARPSSQEFAPLAVALASVLASFGMPLDLEGQALDDDAYLVRHAAHVTTYRGMDALRHCVGDHIHVYHSEVGVTGLRFQAGKVTDLAGLWSPRWLFRKQRSFDEFCNAERPEAIFLPHRNYERLNREILSSSCISHYRRVVEESSSPLYVREDLVSRYSSCPEASEWR